MREITDEVKKVIIGKDEVVDMVFAAILAQGHVLMEDVPGVGKTTLAVAFSKALGLETKRIQFTPDTVASDITGYTAFDRQAQRCGNDEYTSCRRNKQNLRQDAICPFGGHGGAGLHS